MGACHTLEHVVRCHVYMSCDCAQFRSSRFHNFDAGPLALRSAPVRPTCASCATLGVGGLPSCPLSVAFQCPHNFIVSAASNQVDHRSRRPVASEMQVC